MSQKVLYEDDRQDLSKSQKLQYRPIQNYQAYYKDYVSYSRRKVISVVRTVYRNHLVEYYTKEESVPAMI